MKKIIFGTILGIILFSTVLAYTSENITANIFPSRILFHMDDSIKELDSSIEVLNYNNRAYIPLRSFSEMMGANVNYKSASYNTSFFRLIDISMNKEILTDKYTLQDPEGYISIGKLQYKKTATFDNTLVGGTIKINKDLDGKIVFLYSNGVNEINDFGYPLLILNEYIDDLKAGDIRPFTIAYGGIKSTSTKYTIKVTDSLVKQKTERSSNIPTQPLYFIGDVSYEDGTSIHNTGSPLFFEYQIGCIESNVTVKPFNIHLKVYKLDTVSNKETLVFSSEIPLVEGAFEKGNAYKGFILWDERNLNGDFVSPGTYLFKYSIPNTIDCKIEGSDSYKTINFGAPFGGSENVFEIK